MHLSTILSSTMHILIYWTICQVWELVFQLACIISISWKSNKAFRKKVKLKRSHWRYCDINSHIPFKSLYKQRVSNIFLEDTLLFIFQVINSINNKNAPASTQIWRFTDPNSILIAISVIIVNKLSIITRYYECEGSEVKQVAI